MDHDRNPARGRPTDADFDLLSRYVAGECAPEEAAGIERRLESDAAFRALLADVRAIWDNARVEPAGWDAQEAWRSFAERLDAPRLHREEPRPQRDRSRLHQDAPRPDVEEPRAPAVRAVPRGREAHGRTQAKRGWLPLTLRAAAVFVAFALGGGLYYQQVVAPSSPPAREYATGIGERERIELEDGTTITLGAASRLRIAAGYGKRERRVTLVGVALFDVPHDPDRAFVVQTAHGVARDLGTRFDVRSFPGDGATRVVVAEGLVALAAAGGADDEGTVLEPGQLGVTTQSGSVDVRDGVDVERLHAWAEGQLIFEATPLGAALPELSRWYGLDVQLADPSLAKLPVTATFRDQAPGEVLDLLALTLGLRLQRRGETIIFHAGNL